MNKFKFIILFGIIVLFTGCNSTTSNSNTEKHTENNPNKSVLLKNESQTTSTSENIPSISQKKQDSDTNMNNDKLKNEVKTSLHIPIPICDNNENDSVMEKIKVIMSEELNFENNELDTFDVHRSVYEVNLGNLLKDQDKQLLAITPSHATLFKANKDLTEIGFIDTVNDLKLNMNKLQIETKENLISLQSETAFDSSSYKYTIEWNGIKLKLNDVLKYDSIKDYYEKREELIEKEDLDSILELQEISSSIETLSKYEEFYTQPKKIILIANKKAEKYIQEEDYIKASQILGYALNQYTLVWNSVPLLELSEQTLEDSLNFTDDKNLLNKNNLKHILNKYAISLYNIESFSEALKVSSLSLSLDIKNNDANKIKKDCEKIINKK